MNQANAEILRARAKALAVEPVNPETASGRLAVIEFALAEERYAIEAAFLREVQVLEDLTPLPGTPRFVAGIVNVRGRILPVIDIKEFFDLAGNGITDAHRILFVHGGDMEIGILADIVIGMKSIAADAIQSSLPTLTGVREDYLRGVTADRLVILDIARILADPRIVVHEEVEA